VPVPDPRTPICIARGNYADLAANIAALEEGEICYAFDEDSLYVKEGGLLVRAGDPGLPDGTQVNDFLQWNGFAWQSDRRVDAGSF